MKKSLAAAIGTLFLLTVGTPFGQTAKGPTSTSSVAGAQSGPMGGVGVGHSGQMGKPVDPKVQMQMIEKRMEVSYSPRDSAGRPSARPRSCG